MWLGEFIGSERPKFEGYYQHDISHSMYFMATRSSQVVHDGIDMRRSDLIQVGWYALAVWVIVVSLLYFWQFRVLIPATFIAVLRQWGWSF